VRLSRRRLIIRPVRRQEGSDDRADAFRRRPLRAAWTSGTNGTNDMSDIAVIGEAVADAFVAPAAGGAHDLQGGGLDLRVRPGGGPANTAVALARLGTPTCFAGRLARGPFGEMLRAHLAASGVDLSTAVSADEQATLAVAAVDDDGQAAYEFYANGTADWQWSAAELDGLIPARVACVHTGSLALALHPGGPLIEQTLAAVRDRSVVSIDPNVRTALVAPETYRAAIKRWSRLADILRLSEEDFAHLTSGESLETACSAWHADGVGLVVVTRGGRGAIASLNGIRVTVPAMDIDPVDTADTVGAGDAFTAGLLHHLWRRDALRPRLPTLDADTLERAMTFAAHVAGRTCLVPGADPPWAAELGPDGGDDRDDRDGRDD
jgi:fructokinase